MLPADLLKEFRKLAGPDIAEKWFPVDATRMGEKLTNLDGPLRRLGIVMEPHPPDEPRDPLRVHQDQGLGVVLEILGVVLETRSAPLERPGKTPQSGAGAAEKAIFLLETGNRESCQDDVTLSEISALRQEMMAVSNTWRLVRRRQGKKVGFPAPPAPLSGYLPRSG